MSYNVAYPDLQSQLLVSELNVEVSVSHVLLH